MKLLATSGKPVPHPFFTLFSRGSLRRMVPLAALSLAGATQAIAPASALEMTSRMGFQMASSMLSQTNGKAKIDQTYGIFRAGSCAPLTLALSGAETGNAQAVVTAKVGMRTLIYTRAVRLNGAPQTVCVTVSGALTVADEFAGPGTLNIQILQNGRSLTQQEIRMPSGMSGSGHNILDLTKGAGSVCRSLRDYNHVVASRSSNSSAKNSAYNGPRLLTAAPEALPDSAQGYEAIDAIVLNYAYPLEMASVEQQEALHEYVREGGKLILIGESRPGQISTLRNKLAALPFKPAAEKFAADQGIQAAVDGAGLVLSAPDAALAPDNKEFYGSNLQQNYERGIGKQWQFMLNGTGTPLYSPRQALTHSAAQISYNSNELTDALAGRQAAQTVPFPLITGFLLAYIVLIIPVNYLVLKKLDRRELAWITAPALVFLFSGVSYAVAHAIKGGNLTVNRAVIYEGFANTDAVTGHGQFTLYSPHRAAYDISIGDAQDPENPYRSIQPMETQRSERSNSAPDLTVARNASTSLQNVSVPQWDTRSFEIPVTGSLGGGIEARVTLANSTLRYSLTNHTKYDLHDCSVIIGDQNAPIAELKAGETTQVALPWNGNIASNNAFSHLPYTNISNAAHSAFSLHQTNATAEETQALIRESLESILRSNYYNSGVNSSESSASYTQSQNAMACGFIGWFDAKTLDVRVDGHAPEGEQENMLYIHLPLPRNTKVDSGTDAALLRLIPDTNADATNDTTPPLENRDAK